MRRVWEKFLLFWWENLKEKEHLKDLGVDGITLNTS
jgi:hypothetical protein